MWTFNHLSRPSMCVALLTVCHRNTHCSFSVFFSFTLIVQSLLVFSIFYFLLLFSCLFFLPLDFSTCVSLSDTCVLLPSCINSPCLALVLFGCCFCSVVASVPSWLFPPGCLIGFVSVVCIFVQVCKSVSVLFLFFFSINLPFWFLIIVFPFEEGCEDAVD